MLGGIALRGENRELTDVEKMCTSAGAGAMSAVVYGPVDLTARDPSDASTPPWAMTGRVHLRIVWVACPPMPWL